MIYILSHTFPCKNSFLNLFQGKTFIENQFKPPYSFGVVLQYNMFNLLMMENQVCEIEELNFQPRKQLQVQKQSKILEYYAKSDQERQRKAKTQLFNKQSIEGFLSILEINLNKLQFVNEEELLTQLTLIMSNSKKFCLEIGEQINVTQNEFYILYDGCLVKKQDNPTSINQSFITQINRKMRDSRRDSRKSQTGSGRLSKAKQTFIFAVNSVNKKKIAYKRIQSGKNQSPKAIFYDPIDIKPYECRTDCILFQFNKANLQKFQDWLQIKQKQELINFLSGCFGVYDQKSFTKFIHKLHKEKIVNKCKILMQPGTIYLIYYGQILLKTKYYQLNLNKNSIIFKNINEQEYQVYTKNEETLIISIQLATMVELLEESFPHVLEEIKNKINSLHQERKELFQRAEMPIEQTKQIQPIFNTQILNIKSYERNRKYQCLNWTVSDAEVPKYCISRPKTSNLSSTRFRIGTQMGPQNLMQNDQTVFISNYPYQKIVQSQIKIHNILKKTSSGQNKKPPFVYQATTEEQKRKAQKQRKKQYYMNKVRKLKIKNIAEKQIPNGHKKKFDVEGAQKQIQSYSLFSNIIEYPVNGISEDAKESINKNINKIIKITSANLKTDKTEKKVLSRALDIEQQDSKEKSSYRDYSLENVSNFQKTNMEESFNSAQKASRQLIPKIQPSINQYLYEKQLKSNSFYFTKNLNPHLPTQKDMKSRILKTSNNFYGHHEKQNLNTILQYQKIVKFRKSNQKSSRYLAKPSCITLKVPQTALFQPTLRSPKPTTSKNKIFFE